MTKRLIIAGGGTGGHIFPGLAVAEAWKEEGGQVLWVGSTLGKEKVLVPAAGVDLKMLAVRPLKGRSLVERLKAIFSLPKAIWQGLKIIKEFQPDAILGVGGYASFPITLAAWLKRIPRAIAEQNAFAGLTNRVLSKFSKHVFLTFEDDYNQFPARKVKVVGNPIRAAIQHKDYNAGQRPFHILVTGGSLGAKGLNQKFLETMTLLKDSWKDLKVLHHTGEHSFDFCAEFYAQNTDINATPVKFIEDMNQAYQDANLVICRSGASTATELAFMGRPAVFVPFPYAADDHQTKNANYFVKRDAAWIVQEKAWEPKQVAQMVEGFLKDSGEIASKAQNMLKAAKPGAAQKITQELLKIAS